MSQKSRLPKYFKPLFWSYEFASIDPVEHQRLIIVNSLNYGDLKHWRWLIRKYGRGEVKRNIKNIPASEFRKPILSLISLIWGVKQLKYASRSDYTRAQKNI